MGHMSDVSIYVCLSVWVFLYTVYCSAILGQKKTTNKQQQLFVVSVGLWPLATTNGELFDPCKHFFLRVPVTFWVSTLPAGNQLNKYRVYVFLFFFPTDLPRYMATIPLNSELNSFDFTAFSDFFHPTSRIGQAANIFNAFWLDADTFTARFEVVFIVIYTVMKLCSATIL